jgi:hypothetical protein
MTNVLDPATVETLACCLWGALMLTVALAVAELLDEGVRR